jgi:hypothetical protein
MTSQLEQVDRLIRSHRFRYTDEDQLQEGIAAVLGEAGLDPEREVRLGRRDRVDIMVGGIAIEVKVAGSAAGAFEQLQRYAAHDEVEALVLVTSQYQRLPDKAGGKPLSTISLALSNL